jgi:hypothetical protein
VALRKIRRVRPKQASDLRAAGFTLRLLGCGVFREAFKVGNCDLIIKFPLQDDESEIEDCKRHTRTEVARLRRLARHGVMRRFLPKIHYFDSKNGVIVMQYYPSFRDREEQVDALGKMAQALIFKSTKIRCTDIHSENVHRKGKKDAVIIDLGY